MIASTPSLTRFADLGLLPFTGRERELARIARFRAELDAADTMRVAMVTG